MICREIDVRSSALSLGVVPGQFSVQRHHPRSDRAVKGRMRASRTLFMPHGWPARRSLSNHLLAATRPRTRGLRHIFGRGSASAWDRQGLDWGPRIPILARGNSALDAETRSRSSMRSCCGSPKGRTLVDILTACRCWLKPNRMVLERGRVYVPGRHDELRSAANLSRTSSLGIPHATIVCSISNQANPWLFRFRAGQCGVNRRPMH